MKAVLSYAPSTFEERGAAVSFTTPLLSQTRVRMDERKRLEVLIPSFAEGRGVYVVPWKAMPDMVSMTMHDRFLHDAIVRKGACSPHDIRIATLQAARKGLAGPEAVQAARKALEDDESYRTLTNFLLIVEVLKVAGLMSAETLKETLRSAEGEAITRGYMHKAAADMRLEATQLYARVAEMAEAMAPVGLAQAPIAGRLRRCVRALDEFRDSIAWWSRDNPSEAAPVAAFCASVADHTLAIGQSVLDDFDRRARSIGAVIRDWDSQVEVIQAASIRLGWLVDGWDFVVGLWQLALERDAHEQAMTVNEIFRILPLIPTSETRHQHAEEAREVLAKNRRSVRAYEDWRTGMLDVELVERIEKIKAKAA